MHDGRDACHIILHLCKVIHGFIANLLYLPVFCLGCRQLAFKGIDLTFQLTELGHQLCVIAEIMELG